MRKMHLTNLQLSGAANLLEMLIHEKLHTQKSGQGYSDAYHHAVSIPWELSATTHPPPMSCGTE